MTCLLKPISSQKIPLSNGGLTHITQEIMSGLTKAVQILWSNKGFQRASTMVDFKPVPLKTWFLFMVLNLLFVVIVLTEIAFHLLPDGTKGPRSLHELNVTEVGLHAV